MKRTLFLIIILICIPAYAGATTLFLDDWGIEPGVSWIPSSSPSGVSVVTEDYTKEDNGFVGPGYGGQPFDAEAAYMAFADSKLYVAIVTGLPQEGSPDPWRYDNSFYNYYDWNKGFDKYWYAPGDIGLDLGADGSYEYAVSLRNEGDNNSGVSAPGAGLLLSGNLEWEGTKAWSHYDAGETYEGADVWAVTEYKDAVSLDGNFSYSEFGKGHYAIEAIIDLALLDMGEADLLAMHWVMECGNDFINVETEIPANVPEPSTVMLLGLGVAALGIYKRKQKFRRDSN